MESIYNYIKTKILDELTAIGKSLNFAPGDVIDTIVLYVSDGIAKIIDYALAIVKNAFFATADAEFLYRKCDDFGISYSLGEYASGVVRFTRTTNAPTDYIIPAGTIVSTHINRFQGLEYFTTEEVTLLTGTASIEADIQAVIPGEDYNVVAGTIQYLSNAVTGIEAVVQESDVSGGADQDTVEEIRESALEYIRNIGRATKSALLYRARSISGVKYVSIYENPDGIVFEDIDSPFATFTGTWAVTEDNSYHMGEAMTSSTATDYVEFKIEGDSYEPKFDGDCIVDIYVDDVFVESITEPKAFLCTLDKHVVKIVLRSGTVNIDGLEVGSTEPRNSTVRIVIDDGTGTATWALLESVKDSIQDDWRALGILVYYDKTDVQLVDIAITIDWEKHAKINDVKEYAETEIGVWLSKHAPGSLIRMCNIIPIVLPITVAGRRQVVCMTVGTPNIQLPINTVARLNDVIWTENFS